jgi:transposase
VRDTDAAGWRVYLAFEQRRVACSRCQGVKVERLDWLAQNPRYTQRFAQQVGTLCRDMSNKAVAQLLHLHEHTVKDLDTQYMRAWLAKTPQPAPQVIGVDELSIKKGHTYRIVVSDLERGRPIWVGGQGRTAADLDRFFLALGPQKTARIRLAVMDMWKAFRNSVQTHAPQAQILFDKFHILRHLAAAMDQVRRAEYKRVATKDRAFIKGQRYTLLSHRANLTLAGRRSLRKLLRANKRLATAYILKEEFGQLWDYEREGWARRLFENWRASLKWQRLKPYEKFAKMIDRHWDGIAAYCKPENKVALGFVEGMNNTIRVIQRRSYGLRDEEYLRLKVLTCMLDPIGNQAEITHSVRRRTHIKEGIQNFHKILILNPLNYRKAFFSFVTSLKALRSASSDSFPLPPLPRRHRLRIGPQAFPGFSCAPLQPFQHHILRRVARISPASALLDEFLMGPKGL